MGAYTVLDRFVAPRAPGEVSGDIVVVAPEAAAVLDLATRRDGRPWSPSFVEALGAKVEAALRAADLERSSRGVTDALSAILSTTAQAHGYPDASATAAVLLPRERTVVRVGDCWVACDDRVIEPARRGYDRLLGELRSLVLQLEIQGGRRESELLDDDVGRLSIEPFLDRRHRLANSVPPLPWSFAVLTGEHVPDEYIETIPVDGGCAAVTLATDGYPVFRPTLEEAEEVLAGLLSDDRLGISRVRMTKGAPAGGSYDDRAFLRVALPPGEGACTA